MQRTVMVWNKPHVVTLHHESKTVWIATGDYMGRPLSVKDRTQGAALKRWRQAATDRGNG